MSSEFTAAYVLLGIFYVIGFVVTWPFFTRKFFDWAGMDDEFDMVSDHFIAAVVGLVLGLLWPVVLVVYVVGPLFCRYLFGRR